MFKLSRKTRHNLAGYVFVLPFVIGFAAFFLYPFILSILLSISELELGATGFKLTSVGLENYRRALFVHENFVRVLFEEIVRVLRNVPIIVMFSLFVAVMLNQPFRGRLLARVIFFLPVIYASGAVLIMENFDYLTSTLRSAESGSQGALGGQTLMLVFSNLKLPEVVLEYILTSVQGIADIIKASGIQILIFLAGLQSISPSLYEASAMEGATAWEEFWKITFPLSSPLIPTVVLYTIIDSYASVNNKIMEVIRTTTFQGMGYGVSSAMAWIFFALIAVTLAVLIGIISRWVIYQE